MGSIILGILGPIISSIFERVIPDVNARAAAMEQITEAIINGDYANAAAQSNIDANEANSEHVFVAGWRPMIGWACAFAIWFIYILVPLVQFIQHYYLHGAVPLPVFNSGDMTNLTMGMLGMGTLRTVDKAFGTATTAIRGVTDQADAAGD